jgi:hypothetical protein
VITKDPSIPLFPNFPRDKHEHGSMTFRIFPCFKSS